MSITKLADGCPRTNQPDIGVTLWGDAIRDIVYFTPPQSNISELNELSEKSFCLANIEFDFVCRRFVNVSTIRTAHSTGCYD